MRALIVAIALVFVTLMTFTSRVAHAEPQIVPVPAAPGDPQRGGALLVKKGCTSCHSTDGTPRSGPTLLGLWGSKRSVTTAGKQRDALVDDAYIARALRDPDADVPVGFPRGTMPKFEVDDNDAASIARAIEALATPQPAAPNASTPRSEDALFWLAFYSAWFVGFHLLLSSVPVRTRMIKTLSPRRFSAIYSIVSTIGLIGMILTFRHAIYVEVWLPPRVLRWVPVLTMPISILFMVAGFSTKSPTTVGQGAVASDEEGPRGILTVTRHPALFGFALWAAAHLLANGELRAMIIFGAILVLSIAGMLHIDRRRAAELGDAWLKYRERTSLVPFAAIFRGKSRFDAKGIGIVRVLGSAFTYAAILHMHALLIGASPFP